MRRVACLLCLLAGCGAKVDSGADAGAPTGGIEFATCGPTDGPAFGLAIGPGGHCDRGPLVLADIDAIEVWTALPAGAATILVGPDNGSAQTCVAGVCTPVTNVALEIDSTDGGTVTGSYEMGLPDGSKKQVRFVVPICPRVPTCG